MENQAKVISKYKTCPPLMHLRQDYSSTDRISANNIEQAQAKRKKHKYNTLISSLTLPQSEKPHLCEIYKNESVCLGFICNMIISTSQLIKRLYKTHNNINGTPE